MFKSNIRALIKKALRYVPCLAKQNHPRVQFTVLPKRYPRRLPAPHAGEDRGRPQYEDKKTGRNGKTEI